MLTPDAWCPLAARARARGHAGCVLTLAVSCEMQGGGELTLCPWGGYGRGPFRTSDGRYYCLDHTTGSTYWLSLEPPAHLQAEAARLAGKRRPWDKKPADADADAKRPKLNTEGGGEEGAYNHLAFEMPASTSVRVGDSFRARVPGFSPRAAPPPARRATSSSISSSRPLPRRPSKGCRQSRLQRRLPRRRTRRRRTPRRRRRRTRRSAPPGGARGGPGGRARQGRPRGGRRVLGLGLNAGTRRQFKARRLPLQPRPEPRSQQALGRSPSPRQAEPKPKSSS